MDKTLDDFHTELRNEILAEAESSNELTEDTFFDFFSEDLIKAEVIQTADRCFYDKPGLKIDGYGGHPVEDDATLSLIVCDFSNQDEIVSVNRSEIEAMCKRAINFISKSFDTDFREELDMTSPEFGLADLIKTTWDQIQKIKIIYITNKSLNLRNKDFEPIPVNGIHAEFVPWDIVRFYDLMISGKEKEELVIDLAEHGGSITALNASSANNDFESYLCIMPGNTLAKIFRAWGSRLLEQNVRVFLQAKGKVNKGIRSTIEQNPNMFFSYNNGITATASAIKKEYNSKTEKGGLIISSITNFQIVNGGQTTASIHEAIKRGYEENLKDIQIQMKLSVISDINRAEEIVPKISEYANSQNKVNHIDFTSNNRFHVDMENFSRKILAPQKTGTTIQTRWFYERARGQYNQEKALLKTTGEKKKFDTLNPKNQKVTKDQLAIVINTFLCKPDIVSKGSQKCYIDFTQAFTKKQESEESKQTFFDETFFKYSMAKVLIFRRFDELVKKADWYAEGYKRNIVAYGIAKLLHTIKIKKKAINYNNIWKVQKVSEELENMLLEIGKEAVFHLTEAERPQGAPLNTGEYAKSIECWESFKKVPILLNEDFEKTLLNKDEEKGVLKEASKKQKLNNQLETENYIVSLGPDFWKKILKFCMQQRIISPRDQTLLYKAIQVNFVPVDWQYPRLIKIIERAKNSGFKE